MLNQLFGGVLVLVALSAGADEDNDNEEAKARYKATASLYSTNAYTSQDLNLRRSMGDQEVLLGWYEDSTHYKQVRASYERDDKNGSLKLTSSLQIAGRGFIGGYVRAEVGEDWKAIGGISRTNLKEFANINFDPNDAITYGIGYEDKTRGDVSLYRVKDDRVNKGQQVDHLLVHIPGPGNNKTTLDLSSRNGPAQDGQSKINSVGFGITQDWSLYFIRLTFDPKVNFTPENMTRISMGKYF